MKNYYAPVAGARLNLIVRELPFYHGNILKYIWRAPYKGGVQDLLKAIWYLNALSQMPTQDAYKLSEKARGELQLIADALLNFEAPKSELARLVSLKTFVGMLMKKDFRQNRIDDLKICLVDMMEYVKDVKQ